MPDEFYIGYEPEMPPTMTKRVRSVAAVLVALAIALPGLLVVAQNEFSSGVFEFGHEGAFEGRIVELPYPALRVHANADGPVLHYWLVGPGKHGAADLTRGLDGQTVRLSGSLIQRDSDVMLQVVPGSVEAIDRTRVQQERLRTIAPTVVVGEIVDSKCHLGVMKPGEGPTHRDCAVRCLLGEIPPMLVLRGGHSDARRVPLVAPDGSTFNEALQELAGKPVSVRGVLLERGQQRFLATSVAQIRVVR